MLNYEIKIQIWDIYVDDDYFGFKYRGWVLKEDNALAYLDSTHDEDHSRGDNKKAFRHELENGYALEIVMGKIQEYKV